MGAAIVFGDFFRYEGFFTSDFTFTLLPAKHCKHQRLSVGEGVIAYKGRLSFKQYLSAKLTKYGIKLFAICDLVIVFCMLFEIYSGRDEILSCGEGFTFNIVNKLISPYMEYNHILYTDNLYTSINLTRYLRGLRNHLLGTVRNNSKMFQKFWNQTV